MKIIVIIMALVLVAASIFSGCTGTSGTESEQQITVSGAFALYPMMIKWAEEYQKIHLDVKIEISAGGAGKGMTDALSDMVDLGMVSREIYPEEQGKGAVWVPVAKDAVIGTINSKNPVITELQKSGVTPESLDELFVKESIKTWGNLVGNPDIKDEINVYTRSDACGAASVWADYIGGYSQEDLKGIGVSGDPGVAEAVRSDSLGIGYNNINFAYDSETGKPLNGIAIIPLDLNKNGNIDEEEDFYSTREQLIEAIGKGIYPSPPARDLNLVTKDEFKGATKEFVIWILTKGQQYVQETGYLPLPAEQISGELNKISN